MLGCAREPPHPNIIPLNFLSNFQKSCLRAFGPLQCTEHRNSQRNFCLLIFQVVATAYICRYNIRNPARQHQSIASSLAQTVLCLLHASSTLTSFGRGRLWWCPLPIWSFIAISSSNALLDEIGVTSRLSQSDCRYLPFSHSHTFTPNSADKIEEGAQ